MMKAFIPFFLFTITTVFGHAQSDSATAKKETVYTIVEQMPEFPGGEKKMLEFVSDHFKVPSNTPDGKVYVNFVITTEGKVTKARIIKGANAVLDSAGVAVVNSMPDWTPGQQYGKKVNVAFNLPINYSGK